MNATLGDGKAVTTLEDAQSRRVLTAHPLTGKQRASPLREPIET